MLEMKTRDEHETNTQKCIRASTWLRAWLRHVVFFLHVPFAGTTFCTYTRWSIAVAIHQILQSGEPEQFDVKVFIQMYV